MGNNLRFRLTEAVMECNEKRHPQVVMKELGITYKHASAQSIGEQWWFFDCENIPAKLPSYLTPLDLGPREFCSQPYELQEKNFDTINELHSSWIEYLEKIDTKINIPNFMNEYIESTDIYKQAFKILQKMFNDCDDRLKLFINSERSYIKICAPQVFIDLLVQGHKDALGIWPHRSPEGKLYFRDIEVIPNYQMEVVLFHKEYPKTLDHWMIYKIKLNSGKIFG